MGISPILRTPAMQDRNVKRTREEGSSSKMDTIADRFEIMYRKKPNLNPINGQEDTIQTVEIIGTDTVVKKNTAPTVSKETHQPST